MKLVEVRKGDYYDLSGVRCLHIDEADKEIWLTSWKGQYKLPLTFSTLTEAVECLEGLVANSIATVGIT